MSYSIGDIILVKFPFTNLKKSKKRPVLVIKNESENNDIICFQITSNDEQTHLLKINNKNLIDSHLTLESYIKYDKCFTISTDIIDKKIAKIDTTLLEQLKSLFCKEIF